MSQKSFVSTDSHVSYARRGPVCLKSQEDDFYPEIYTTDNISWYFFQLNNTSLINCRRLGQHEFSRGMYRCRTPSKGGRETKKRDAHPKVIKGHTKEKSPAKFLAIGDEESNSESPAKRDVSLRSIHDSATTSVLRPIDLATGAKVKTETSISGVVGDMLLSAAYPWSNNSCWLDSGLQLLFVAFSISGMDDLRSICSNLSHDSIIRSTVYAAMEYRHLISPTDANEAISKSLGAHRDDIRSILMTTGIIEKSQDSPFVRPDSFSFCEIKPNHA